MLRGWLGGRQSASTHSLTSLDEAQALEDAMHAASHMMNDDMVTAEEELSKGSSAFHKLGLGVAAFLRATLGFERDIMREASERLAEAEVTAYEHQKRAQRHPNTSHTSAYSAGTEFALALAEVQLMGAVVGVLTESVTESIKGFYKLRKAYLALDSIVAEEKKYLESIGAPSAGDPTSAAGSSISSGTTSDIDTPSESPEDPSSGGVDTPEYHDAEEKRDSVEKTVTYLGHLSSETDLSKRLESVDLDESSEKQQRLHRLASTLPEGPDADVFGRNHVDAFIHSGSNMCFGVLLLMLSLLPPAFSTLGKIAGFRGDRKRGLGLLWQATKFGNINGAFAGLVLLGFYNSMLGFCDIIPSSGTGSYPRELCETLLENFRKRYPKSRLWLLEEARMISGQKQPDKALQMLNSLEESSLKQVLALQWFEKSMNNMYLHNYEACSEAFLKMIELNKWSHGLYYYISGSALVERYRELKSSEPEKAPEMAEKAKAILDKVQSHVGKRTIMAKRLPFDVFVSRKILKWEQRAKEWNVDLVDAVGVSPIEEMIYFWNGYKRMRAEHLEISLKKLAWSKSVENPHWEKEDLDEQAIESVLRATTLRNLQKTKEARDVLEAEVLCHPWEKFKGGNKDNWTLPIAHYEMGVNHWQEYQADGDKESLEEALKQLEKVSTWENFDLDARIGMRVTTGRDTVKREIASLSGMSS